jgi:tRNA (guanine37-N1)-methyltransferase
VREALIDEEISIGDYVLAGGETAAMVIVETVSRQVPGVVGQEESVQQDSFFAGLLDHPHYTRPAEFRGRAVPEVLLSGDHAAIARWRRREALRQTLRKRPDLLEKAPLTPEDRSLLERIKAGDVDPG